ncbi:sensor histidine kinase [Bartonella sp. HY761]|uniref:sensor histidine kinase n=1 Tax=Bartonella sp. HY761 TaxID=2979330 RepID=UPI0022091EC2|nr:HAMP domain-containing sensor histidine kinase [Bartonella sp. HY761]UXN05221.1 HAMP domain-containing histidine kinase [Bartonella sp. HY761]
MKHKAMIKLTVSTQGYIRAFQGETHLYGFFQKGKHLAESVHINDKIALVTLLDNARIGKKDSGYSNFRFINKDGMFIIFQLGNVTLGINGINIDCQLIDKTVSRQISAPTSSIGNMEQDSNAILNEMPPLTLVAHEMREPLNAIIGFTDFLLHEFSGKFETSLQRQYAMHIKESGNHLLQLITTYLEKQQEQDKVIDQDVDSTIAEAIVMTSHLTQHSKVVFTSDLHGSCFTTLKSLQLKQVMINLITNAAKYSGDGSIITIQQRVLKNNHLLLTVSDTGTGIAEEEIEELRHPFKRASNVLSSNIDGYGIGLSLVFGIVEAAKGRVNISSRRNRGTTISLTLPLGNGPQLDKANKHQKIEADNLHFFAINNKTQTVELHEKYLGDGKSKQKIDKTA